ncbi:MAG: hypothetical protein CSB49_08285 [Proteobacteria bacterium]|nr:MAG: hypothetical protein CSB49_08285 [Pseudomonadota bacterium]
MNSVAFDETMRAGWTHGGERWSFELPSGWGQGRAVFGGLTVAAAASLALRIATRSSARMNVRSARSARSCFAPSPGAVEGRCRLLREGNNVSFPEGRLAQEGKEALVASVVLAKRREGALLAVR